ncbi:MAG TPA: 2-dehydropantoate 2-reductase N-terminal domain-containing protein [Acidimicrobiales bacterium]|jgi:2-dehydropantoate 2-reductase|nr:2-dehydropantoate 2-reductase N-terminal domain-containing protein [Acidimicrobiales bacterium]
MRFVVYGAGGIGGVLGARLLEHGHAVVLIARGAHGEAIADRGLTVESPAGSVTLPIQVVATPDAIAWDDDDVALLAMKAQDTAPALSQLAALAGWGLPVMCVQNGVVNERIALRRFENVYGVCVMCPTTYLEPGVVQANSTPTTGILDIGRYPNGVDETATAIAAAFARSTYVSEPRVDIMRWKYRKLLMNLGNAIEAACGPSARAGELADRARDEGTDVLRVAGIDVVSEEEDRARRGDLLRLRPINGARRGGGSTWQSLARGARALETDFLNGEIVLLGREHGVATPVNELLQRVARELARTGAAPGSMTPDDLLARLDPA